MRYDTIYDTTYLLTAIGFTPGGRSTVDIFTQTIHTSGMTQLKRHRTTLLNNTVNN